ncbi:ESCO acetyltransferase domain-containing protein [Leishmania donovani]|uniref:ESCO_acetyltransferase_domain-containing_protein/ GeneDB:LmjF.20.0346 n=1 Tax=Leishmania donovani TaxID=5661 RepID=A0A6J8FBI9_LEIDO|nr:ESCO acetyltransferase domain-containing protein [Leishmania donovani]VDZ44212.1 ESCO_acetyltransferase_domain-containing_protein/GeneDB:LmjF.20.0346 [Leishmania donovani]
MPAQVQFTDLDSDAHTLPSTWRSLADIKKHVFSPGYVVEGEAGCCTGVAESARPLLAAATIVLYDFFAERVCRKRSRGKGAPAACAGCDDSAPGGHRKKKTVRHSCCSATLRSAVLAVLHTAHESIGSPEAVSHGGCVVIVHVKATREDVRCASPKTASRVPVWLVDGVCVAEDVPRAYRAVWTSPAISSEPPTHSTTEDNTTVAAALGTSDSSSCLVTVEGQLRAQVTRVGDSWCTGTPLCGVRLMWVSPASRGRGVAYSMIERARHAVCYGFVVPPEHVAFSEPTAMGSAFARRYQARQDFLVYHY